MKIKPPTPAELERARAELDDARKNGWVVRPALHNSRTWVAERGTFADSRRLFAAGEVPLALLLQQRGSRTDRPRRERRDKDF